MAANVITVFNTPTRHVGSTPYCASSGKAVWQQAPREICAQRAQAVYKAFRAAYANVGIAFVEETVEGATGAAYILGSGGTWRIQVVRRDGGGAQAVVRCRCHALEIAAHMASL
jgi:hypothetical protein